MVPHLHIRQCVCVCVEEATLASLGKSGHFHIKTCLADDVRGCAKGRPRPAVVQKKIQNRQKKKEKKIEKKQQQHK